MHFLLISLLDAARVIVYYDENEESAIAIVYEAVELGHFSEEESFTAQEDATLRILIEEAIPLMDEAVYEFARSVYDALATVDDHPSFKDSEIEKYDRLKEKEKYVPSNLKKTLPIALHKQQNAPHPSIFLYTLLLTTLSTNLSLSQNSNRCPKNVKNLTPPKSGLENLLSRFYALKPHFPPRCTSKTIPHTPTNPKSIGNNAKSRRRR